MSDRDGGGVLWLLAAGKSQRIMTRKRDKRAEKATRRTEIAKMCDGFIETDEGSRARSASDLFHIRRWIMCSVDAFVIVTFAVIFTMLRHRRAHMRRQTLRGPSRSWKKCFHDTVYQQNMQAAPHTAS